MTSPVHIATLISTLHGLCSPLLSWPLMQALLTSVIQPLSHHTGIPALSGASLTGMGWHAVGAHTHIQGPRLKDGETVHSAKCLPFKDLSSNPQTHVKSRHRRARLSPQHC